MLKQKLSQAFRLVDANLVAILITGPVFLDFYQQKVYELQYNETTSLC